MRTINEIIIHCSATPSYRYHTAADIRQWHLQRGYKDIGYHYVIRTDGIVEQGRPIEEIGAHCTGHNSNSIGICYVGGYNSRMVADDTRTPAQRAALIDLLQKLIHEYPTIRIISGHRQYASKACPCFDARTEYSFLLR